MRSGFTTGSCAAVSARAAVQALETGTFPERCQIVTPKGIVASMQIHGTEIKRGYACCGVYKDAGDDPDITNGTWVGTAVFTAKADPNDLKCPSFLDKWREVWEHGYLYQASKQTWIGILGGEGVGIVSKRGLVCPPERSAINPIPREMIANAVAGAKWKEEATKDKKEEQDKVVEIPCTTLKDNVTIWKELLKHQDKSFIVEVRIPEGRELAQKTFNPNLGIQGGLSVLGTSGIVEPMSEDALRKTIRLELHIKAVEGQRYVVLTPGNYGEAFIRDTYGFSLKEAVKCSNFIGDAIQMAKEEGFFGVLLVGHIGKLIKVSLGVMNTHSKYGDRRMEGFLEAMQAGRKEGGKESKVKESADASADFLACMEAVRQSNTSEEAVEHLKDAGYLEDVMEEIIKRIQNQLQNQLQSQLPTQSSHQQNGIHDIVPNDKRKGNEMQIEVVTFSSQFGVLGQSQGAKQFLPTTV